MAAVSRVPRLEPGAMAGPGFPWQQGKWCNPQKGTGLVWEPDRRAECNGPGAGAEGPSRGSRLLLGGTLIPRQGSLGLWASARRPTTEFPPSRPAACRGRRGRRGLGCCTPLLRDAPEASAPPGPYPATYNEQRKAMGPPCLTATGRRGALGRAAFPGAGSVEEPGGPGGGQWGLAAPG